MMGRSNRGAGLIVGVVGMCLSGGCGDDGGGDGIAGSGTDTGAGSAGPIPATTTGDAGSTTGMIEQCPGMTGSADLYQACASNGDCRSGVCRRYRDASPGVCVETPSGCNMRISGTLLALGPAPTPVSGVAIEVVGELDAMLIGTAAPAVAEGESDSDGRVDITTAERPATPIGLLALVAADETHHPTASVLARVVSGTENNYAVGNTWQDIWAVSRASLETWNAALAEDVAVADALPLESNPLVVGLVRDRETGEPIAGAIVRPEREETIVRYLIDGGFTDAATGTSGVFVVLGLEPTGESFAAVVGGEVVAQRRIGARAGMAFTLMLDAAI